MSLRLDSNVHRVGTYYDDVTKSIVNIDIWGYWNSKNQEIVFLMPQNVRDLNFLCFISWWIKHVVHYGCSKDVSEMFLTIFLSIYNTPCNHICSYWYYPICFDDQWYRWFGTITYGYIKRFIYPLHRWYLQNKAYFKLIKSWIMFLTFWPFEGCGMCSYEKKKKAT